MKKNFNSDNDVTNIHVENIELFDQERKRRIPLAIYKNSNNYNTLSTVVILSHGYLVKHTRYEFIAHTLAHHGYTVVSIQHDLPQDPPLPQAGNIFVSRQPIWQKGVANILFVLDNLKEIALELNVAKVILIGHSNGGDISMVFSEQRPESVAAIISLDSLRYPFPVAAKIPILSIRSNDRSADPEVLPEVGATIVKLDNAKHTDMCDRGPEEVKQQIIKLIINFIQFKG